MLFATVQTIARPIEPSIEERVSDCKVDFGSGNSNRESITAIRNCILEKSEITKSIHHDNNKRVLQANEEIVSSQIPIFRTLLTFAVFISIVLAALGKGIWEKSKSDVSEGVYQFLLAMFVSTGLLAGVSWISVIVTALGQYRLTEFSTQTISAAKILADSNPANKRVIESNMSEVSVLVKTFTSNVINSEVCANSFVQNHINSTYHYDFKGFDIAADDEVLLCIDSEKKNFGTFSEHGRTALNYAVKICSSKKLGTDHDCGKVSFSDNTTDVLKAKLDAISITLSETVNSYSEVLCTLYAKNFQEKAEEVCNVWDGSQFTLKHSTLHKDDVDRLLVQQVAVLNKELVDALAEGVDNKNNLSSVYLFSFINQMYSLFFSDFDEAKVLADVSKQLQSVSFQDQKVTLLNNGYESNPSQDNNSMYVDGLNDFNKMMTNGIDQIMSSDAVNYESNKSFLSILYDPKELVGSYYGKKYMTDRCNDKGCYEFDVLAFKKLVQNTPQLLYTLVGVKYSAAVVQATGDSRSKMLAMKIGGKIKLLIIFLTAIYIYVLVKFILGGVYSFFADLIRKNLTLIYAAVAMLVTKGNSDVLKNKGIEFYYSFLTLTNVLISLVLTHLILSVAYDYISAYRLQQAVLNNSVVDYGVSIVWVLVFLISYLFLFEFIYQTVERFVADNITKLGTEDDIAQTNLSSVKANVSKSM